MKRFKEHLKGFLRNGRNIAEMIACGAVAYAGQPIAVFASNTDYLKPLTNLKTILLAIAAAAGAVLLIWGAIKFAIAWIQHNQGNQHDAVFFIAGGGVLMFISGVVTILTT